MVILEILKTDTGVERVILEVQLFTITVTKDIISLEDPILLVERMDCGHIHHQHVKVSCCYCGTHCVYKVEIQSLVIRYVK